MKRRFKQFNFKDPDLNRVQDAVATAFNEVDNPLDGAVLLSRVSLKAGVVNAVLHRLGRVPVSYLVAAQNADSRVWSQKSEAPASVLILLASSDVTVDLIVF